MMACGNKHFKCVKYLINNNADINVYDFNHDNLLHGCIYHNTYDILLLLLTNKNLTIINDKNVSNESPLMYAIKLNINIEKPAYLILLFIYIDKCGFGDLYNLGPKFTLSSVSISAIG